MRPMLAMRRHKRLKYMHASGPFVRPVSRLDELKNGIMIRRSDMVYNGGPALTMHAQPQQYITYMTYVHTYVMQYLPAMRDGLLASSALRLLRDCLKVRILHHRHTYVLTYIFVSSCQVCELQSGSSCFDWLLLNVRQLRLRQRSSRATAQLQQH